MWKLLLAGATAAGLAVVTVRVVLPALAERYPPIVPEPVPNLRADPVTDAR